MHESNHPKIARAPEKDGEEQANGENRCKYPQAGKIPLGRREVVGMQGTKREGEIARQDASKSAPTPNQLSLKYAAIQELLVKTPNHLWHKNK